MRKRIFQLRRALVLSALLTAPAFAGEFRSDIFCDSPTGNGKGKIRDKGTVQFNVEGLPPNETFRCDVECVVFGESFAQSCMSDSQGRLDAIFEQALDVCIGPVFEIEEDSNILCASGFVSRTLIPSVPHP